MKHEQRAMVRDAVTVHKRLSCEIGDSVPFWPLGLTAAAGPCVTMGLRCPGTTYLTLWRLPGATATFPAPVPHLRSADVSAELLFPAAAAAGWSPHWNRDTGVLHIACSAVLPTSAVIQLTRK